MTDCIWIGRVLHNREVQKTVMAGLVPRERWVHHAATVVPVVGV